MASAGYLHIRPSPQPADPRPRQESCWSAFPSQLIDVKNPWIFTRAGLGSASHEYSQFTRGRGPQEPERGRMFPAPWGGETVFARAHADENAYYVQVKKKIPFTKWSRWVPMRVNGQTYGQILAADKHFKQSAKGAPTAELIQMSCSPAAGSAARESAESLHSASISPVATPAKSRNQVGATGRMSSCLVVSRRDCFSSRRARRPRRKAWECVPSPVNTGSSPVSRLDCADRAGRRHSSPGAVSCNAAGHCACAHSGPVCTRRVG